MSTDDTSAARRGSGSNDLLGRLEAHACMHDDLVMHDVEQAQWAADLRMAKAEIERLRDVLTRIQQWADAYPLELFPEVLRQDWQRANALLAEKGISMSAMSASNMRHVLSGVRAMVDEGLKA